MLTNSKSKLSFRALPQDDPLQRKPTIELAKHELSWEPKIALKEGLQSTINYFSKVI